jgi:ActR/RegA family two-component response regulator
MHEKVLLVDDEQGFVEAMEKRLAKRGMVVRTALSGEAALTPCKPRAPRWSSWT